MIQIVVERWESWILQYSLHVITSKIRRGFQRTAAAEPTRSKVESNLNRSLLMEFEFLCELVEDYAF